MRLTRPALVVTAALLAVPLAGCGQAGPTGTEALDAPQSAAVPSPPGGPAPPAQSPSDAPAGSPAPSPSPSAGDHVAALDVQGLARAVRHTMSAYHSAHVTMRMSGNGFELSAQGDVRYAADGPMMRMRMHVPSLGVRFMQLRMVHGMVYLAMPPLTPSHRWVEIDPSDQNSPFGPSVAALAKTDPMSSFGAVEVGVRKVAYVGQDRVQGEPMSHYRVTVSTRAAARATGQPLPPGVPRTVRYDLWLDAQNRSRRMRLDELGITTVCNVTRWGVPVHVRAPARSLLMRLPGTG